MLKKKDYGSKKKNRRMAFIERERVRAAQERHNKLMDKVFRSGSIEDAAKAMEIRLK